MFNDFGEFTVNLAAEPKTIIFPSFENVLNLPQVSQKHYLLDLFYKIIQSKPNNYDVINDIYSWIEDHAVNVKLDSEVAGSAIMGALVSQEVIKSFSKSSHPVNNLLIFDSKNLKNVVARIGVIS